MHPTPSLVPAIANAIRHVPPSALGSSSASALLRAPLLWSGVQALRAAQPGSPSPEAEHAPQPASSIQPQPPRHAVSAQHTLFGASYASLARQTAETPHLSPQPPHPHPGEAGQAADKGPPAPTLSWTDFLSMV